ncbi:MAG: hypothetical protein LUG18_10795 [Candidatus Azobacteroides sp.]|nr:hypothetical protein [Candidatus Azobacteroides sp.]
MQYIFTILILLFPVKGICFLLFPEEKIKTGKGFSLLSGQASFLFFRNETIISFKELLKPLFSRWYFSLIPLLQASYTLSLKQNQLSCSRFLPGDPHFTV